MRRPLFDGGLGLVVGTKGDRRRAGDAFYSMMGGCSGCAGCARRSARSSPSRSISSSHADARRCCSARRAAASRRCCGCAWASIAARRRRDPLRRRAARSRRAPAHRLRHPGGRPLPASDGAAERGAARARDRPRAEVDARIAELAELVQLPPSLLARHPLELSGGQRQRVSLMRALVLDPEALLARRAVRRARSDHPRRAAAGSAAHRAAARQDDRDGHATISATPPRSPTRSSSCAPGAWCSAERSPALVRAPVDPFVTQFIEAQRAPLRRLDG